MAHRHPRKEPRRLRPASVRAAVQEAGRVSPTDPMGMYTGRPAEPGAKPQQDADDL